jgi:hypothetical protein
MPRTGDRKRGDRQAGNGTAGPRAGRTRRERPWWLQEEAVCAACLQGHALRFEVRCSGCDVAVCRSCAVIVRQTGEVLCVVCVAVAGEQDPA